MIEELVEEQIEELEQDLRSLKEELLELLEQTRDGVKPVELDQEAVGRVSRIDAIQQQKMLEAQRSRHKVRLKQVEAALRRVREDEYGVCLRCEEPIGFRRLKVMPESAMCMACLNRIERRP